MFRFSSRFSLKLGIICGLFFLIMIVCSAGNTPINNSNSKSELPVLSTTQPSVIVPEKTKDVSPTTSIILPSKSNLPVDSRRYTSSYDVYFNKYSKRYFGPGFNWKWFKAQALAESALNEDAVSYVGARGIMQVMPATFSEIKMKNNLIIGHIDDPRWNIEAGIYYDSQLFKTWKAERPFDDRLCFMFASYNAGLGNVLKGQKQCMAYYPARNCNLWENIVLVASNVSSWKSSETLEYVNRIFRFMRV